MPRPALTAIVCALALIFGVSAAGAQQTFVAMPMKQGSYDVNLYSLQSGKLLRTVAMLPDTGGDISLSTGPAGIWVTQANGPRCANATGTTPSSECEYEPSSCSSTVMQLQLDGANQTVMSLSSSETLDFAVPGPGGRSAIGAGDCVTSYFNYHLVLSGPNGSATRTLGADAVRCHSLSPPSWNAGGTELAFTYGRSTVPAGQPTPTAGEAVVACPAPQPAGIVIASARRSSKAMSWHAIPPPEGCTYVSVAFDRPGIVAFEECEPRGGSVANIVLGPDYVVQLSAKGKVQFRLPLKRTANPGQVASDPKTGTVLVSQDQTFNSGFTAYDYVWQLTGRHLRRVLKQPGTGAPGILAYPLS